MKGKRKGGKERMKRWTDEENEQKGEEGLKEAGWGGKGKKDKRKQGKEESRRRGREESRKGGNEERWKGGKEGRRNIWSETFQATVCFRGCGG